MFGLDGAVRGGTRGGRQVDVDSEGRKPRLAASGMANEDKARVYWDSS